MHPALMSQYGPYVGLLELCKKSEYPAVVILQRLDWEAMLNHVAVLYDDREGWYFYVEQRTRCYPFPRLMEQERTAPICVDLRKDREVIVRPYP